MTDQEMTGRQAALENAIASIEKQFGKGAIMTMGGENSLGTVELIPTGILSVDLALGGGVPRGRIMEIYGPESSGKTTLATYIIGQDTYQEYAWREYKSGNANAALRR